MLSCPWQSLAEGERHVDDALRPQHDEHKAQDQADDEQADRMGDNASFVHIPIPDTLNI